MSERDYWLGFAVCPGVGPKRFSLLLVEFKTAQNAWEGKGEDLKKILGPKLTSQFLTFRGTFSLNTYLQKLKQKNVWFVTGFDKEFPKRLASIDNPPFVLFGKGDKKVLNASNMISIVGTRKVTQYGRQVTEMITTELVQTGFIIVSGLAMGVDGIAHRTTLENNGLTIAVLGCGVDCCTPKENEATYQEIIESGGVVISEFPLSMMPSKGSFPSRNRIIAGMAKAVIVTEGAEDSGSLITANNALQFGRKVFAVPGPITSQLSNGPMRLIRKGAILITSGEDILNELGIKGDKREEGRKIKGETKEEQRIIDLLKDESLSFNELVKLAKIPSSQLGTVLSLMEVKGMIQLAVGGKISLVN